MDPTCLSLLIQIWNVVVLSLYPLLQLPGDRERANQGRLVALGTLIHDGHPLRLSCVRNVSLPVISITRFSLLFSQLNERDLHPENVDMTRPMLSTPRILWHPTICFLALYLRERISARTVLHLLIATHPLRWHRLIHPAYTIKVRDWSVGLSTITTMEPLCHPSTSLRRTSTITAITRAPWPSLALTSGLAIMVNQVVWTYILLVPNRIPQTSMENRYPLLTLIT